MNLVYVVRYKSPFGTKYIEQPLYWWHEEDKFSTVPKTQYKSWEEAEGGILWIIGRKGLDYMGSLEVVPIYRTERGCLVGFAGTS